jgi:hypothetical protein
MSFYDDAKFMFLAGGAAGKDGKIYNVKPVEELSSTDLVINGDFSIDGPGADGALGTAFGSYGWNTIATDESANVQEGTTTIKNGLLKLTNASGDVDCRAYITNGSDSRNVLTTNSYYRLVYTIVENNGCTDFRIYNGAGAQESAPFSVGTHTKVVRNTSNQLFLFFNKTESSSISIDNVSLKQITNQLADFTFTRGTNLTATRVGKDGYIEKGREQLLVNTVWAGAGEDTQPTSWSKSLTADGTFDTTSTDGQIRFQAPTSSDRAFLTTPDISATGVLAQSVFVDAVDVVCQVDTLMRNNTGASATRIGIFEDGVEVTTTENVKAGKRYTMVWNKTANTRFRFGIGCDGGVAGDITLSRPQLEYGLAATAYIENTSTSATATAGLLEDEPRFDYTGGGCPALLMEPTRTNELPHSEYLESWSFNGNAGSVFSFTQNHAISPDGGKNASKYSATVNYRQIRQIVTLETSTNYVFSFYAKNIDATKARYRVYNASTGYTGDVVAATDYLSSISTSEWTRIEVPFTTDANGTSYGVYLSDGLTVTNSGDSGGNILFWGAQVEKGTYSSSYIPTYGASATRAKEGATDSYDQTSVLDLSSSGLDGEDVSWFFELKNNQYVIRDNGGLTIRVSSNSSNNGSFRIYRPDAVNPRRLNVVFQDTGGSFDPTGYEVTSENPKVLVKRTWSTGRIQVYVDGASVIDGIDLDYNAWYKLELAGEGSTLELKQVLAFPMVLSNNDSEILTGTSYSSFAAMATSTALNYTLYE